MNRIWQFFSGSKDKTAKDKKVDVSKSKNVNTGDIDTKGGNVHLGDNYYKSLEYKELKAQIEQYEDFITGTTDQDLKVKYGQKLQKAKKRLEDFKNEVIELVETFNKIVIDSERLRSAEKHFQNGEFREARAVLDSQTMTTELDALLAEKERLEERVTENQAMLRQKSTEFLILAQLTAIQYDLESRVTDASNYYRKSLAAERNGENTFRFAYFLHREGELTEALSLYKEAFEMCGDGTLENEVTRADTLNNMAIIHESKSDFKAALICHEGASTIKQDLIYKGQHTYEDGLLDTHLNLGQMLITVHDYSRAEALLNQAIAALRKSKKSDTDEIQAKLAAGLNHAGNLYHELGMFERSGKALHEALEIYEHLCEKKPLMDYWAGLADALANLGILMQEVGQVEQSLDYSLRALGIRHALMKEYPKLFVIPYATLLNSLAHTHDTLDQPEKARNSFEKAVELMRSGVADEPETYQPTLAMTLTNYAHWLRRSGAREEAKEYYEEATSVYRSLTEGDVYQDELGKTLKGCAQLFREDEDPEGFMSRYREIIDIYLNLYDLNPIGYSADLALTLAELAMFYQERDVNKEEAMDYLEKAFFLLVSLDENENAKKYMEVVYIVLINYGVNMEEYIQEKLKS